MARIPESDYGSSPYKKIMGNNPAIQKKWAALEEEFYSHPTLGTKLLEQVRRVSAWGQECEYWMSFGGPPDEVHQDKRIAAAVTLARVSIKNPHEIEDVIFEKLNSLFNKEELSTLCSFIAFISGANKFGIIVGLSKNDSPAKKTNFHMEKKWRNLITYKN